MQPKICSCGLVMARVNGVYFCPRCDRPERQAEFVFHPFERFGEEFKRREASIKKVEEAQADDFAAGCADLGKAMDRLIGDILKTMEDDLNRKQPTIEMVSVYCDSCQKKFEVTLALAAVLGDVVWCTECRDQKAETN